MHEAFTDPLARDWDTTIDTTIRFAVVGLGGFARGVALPAIAESNYCETTAVVSGDDEKRDAVAADRDAKGLSYDEYDDGVADDTYDAVYVATPNRLHLPYARTAAERGKAVICEKPLEATPERAHELCSACADVPLMTAYRMQTDPLLRSVRAFLHDGGIGKVFRAEGEFTYPVLASRGPDQWRLDSHLAGGGALMDVGVYPLNTTRFLLGDVTWVDGITRSDGPFNEVDEHVEFHVGFANTVGSFTASFSGHAGTRLALRGMEGRLELTSVFEPNTERRLVVERGDQQLTLKAGVNEVCEEFDYFAHAVATDGEIEPDGADGVRDVELMTAVYEAAAEGTRIEVGTGEAR